MYVAEKQMEMDHVLQEEAMIIHELNRDGRCFQAQ